jgi:hypothetical protein
VLGHLLINAELVAGGAFTPADPTAQDETKRVASLTLLTPCGDVTVTDDAAFLLWDYLVQNHCLRVGPLDNVAISKEAVNTLSSYFLTAHPSQALAHTCKAIVDQLVSRIA